MSRTVKAVVIKQKTERAIHKSQSFLILYVSLYDFVRNIFEIFFNFPVTCTILFTAMPDRQVWGGVEVILNISEKLQHNITVMQTVNTCHIKSL